MGVQGVKGLVARREGSFATSGPSSPTKPRRGTGGSGTCVVTICCPFPPAGPLAWEAPTPVHPPVGCDVGDVPRVTGKGCRSSPKTTCDRRSCTWSRAGHSRPPGVLGFNRSSWTLSPVPGSPDQGVSPRTTPPPLPPTSPLRCLSPHRHPGTELKWSSRDVYAGVRPTGVCVGPTTCVCEEVDVEAPGPTPTTSDLNSLEGLGLYSTPLRHRPSKRKLRFRRVYGVHPGVRSGG